MSLIWPGEILIRIPENELLLCIYVFYTRYVCVVYKNPEMVEKSEASFFPFKIVLKTKIKSPHKPVKISILSDFLTFFYI